jgi:hypothetical protein
MNNRIEFRYWKLLILLLSKGAIVLSGQSVPELDLNSQRVHLEADLEEAIAEYDALSGEIAAKKMALVTPLNRAYPRRASI